MCRRALRLMGLASFSLIYLRCGRTSWVGVANEELGGEGGGALEWMGNGVYGLDWAGALQSFLAGKKPGKGGGR